jgi:hypothetical protein
MKRTLKANKSEVMKKAWSLYRMSQKWINSLSFSECLKRAWVDAKAKSVEYFGQVTLNINGIYCEVNTFNGYVVGNTYKVREILKQYGLEYNGYERLWEGNREAVQELCREFAM